MMWQFIGLLSADNVGLHKQRAALQ